MVLAVTSVFVGMACLDYTQRMLAGLDAKGDGRNEGGGCGTDVSGGWQQFEMWGDGKQTRSFCYVDDAVEGLMRVMQSDYKEPLNVGELGRCLGRTGRFPSPRRMVSDWFTLELVWSGCCDCGQLFWCRE